MNTVERRIREMLAKLLTRDFRWLDVMGSEDEDFFLGVLDEAFTILPPGFSLGSGKQPFGRIEMVARDGIEPPTRGFSVRCSTS